MNDWKKQVKHDLAILGVTIFLAVLGILFMFGPEFYEEGIQIHDFYIEPFSVTVWVLAFFVAVVFGLKALSEGFKYKPTNLIFGIASVYLFIVFLSLWNAYNEIHEMIEPMP